MSIPTINNGDSMFDVRTLKLNPTITQVNQNTTNLGTLITKTTRIKSEMNWVGVNIPLTNGTVYNLVTLLKATPQTNGTFAPMFDTTANKMVAGVNDDRTLFWKLVIEGSFSGPITSSSGSLEVDFTGGIVEKYINGRDNYSAPDIFNFTSLISVDKNGLFVTNGATVSLTALDRDFTITRVRLIAEQ
ncbi:hypothetical protein LAh8_72 [Aeromonas phage LAh_8]|uniref:Sf6-type phage tail needle knob domain-containing protein n=1 Tax=Aeromonas phage LAh_8 TaxID=2591032 RepID=A0A514A0G4_9CAUD|nr:hypothetical protein HWC31_gp072 [Aeromonas phage LAh_8]QDH46764.1 hypothetical protein LAh8_72 [Aeromonas phage LAh_8]